jgi:hypothetical protein
MSTFSNAYATKIFAEHPISLYALDDDVSYISLISDEQRKFEADSPYAGWSVTNGSADDDIPLPSLPSPFVGGPYGGIAGDLPSANDFIIEWQSPELFKLSDLNQELGSFAIALYLYQFSIFINWYEVGYSTGSEEFVTRVQAPDRPSWINFDFTYMPEQYNNDDVKIVIRANVNLNRGSAVGQIDDYRFLVNGLSIGQWSETTSAESLGATPESAPMDYFGVPTREYGIIDEPGYYIVEENRLLAKNEGTPLVYGAKNLTRIYPSPSSGPSLIIPGNGFLFESNRYERSSIEFWFKADPNTEEFKRIFGPVDNDYGVYVNNGFISLLIGDSFASHPVSEWYRTMLVNIVVDDSEVRLYINGENVLSVPIDKENIVLTNENDWVAFYSCPEINVFELDCISFYSYPVPLPVAKRRFVYGQGTESPQTLASSFKGTTSYVDFSNANYTFNTIYPDTANWSAGYKDNLISTKSSISVPDYQLPEITIVDRDIQELYRENKNTNDLTGETFFTFRPLAPSTANLVPNGFFNENIDGWEKINNTALSRVFDEEKQQSAMRVASFNNWQRVLTDGVETLDWENWDDGEWEDVLFFESDGFIAGAKTSQRILISPNLAYRFSIDVKRIIGTSNDPYVLIEWFDAASGGNKLGENESTPFSVPLNQWTTLEVSAISPPGSEYARLTFFMSRSQVSSGEVQIVTAAQLIPLELNWTEPGYIFFDSLNFVERLTSFYGVFSSRDLSSYSPLVVIRNISGFDEFRIFVENNSIRYTFNGELLYLEELEFEGGGLGGGLGGGFQHGGYYYGPEQEYFSFVAGINISQFSQQYGYAVSRFFQSPELLQMYVAGDTVETFYDRLFSFGFCNETNNQEIENNFLENGVIDRFEFENLLNHFATYTLTPINRYNRFFMDISVSALWEEYFPLSSFAGFVKNIDGDVYYDVDMLQINLGYPPVTEIKEETIQDIRWTYAELFKDFNIPIQKSYNILNNPSLSGYQIYAELDFKRITQFFLDTEKSQLRSYVTFQALSDGANEPISNFPFTRNLSANRVIDPDIENNPAQPFRSYLTKFEFVDRTIVFPPKTIKFDDIAMVVHFDIKQEGILSNPLKVRDFEITSRALSQYDFNPIGTEFGTPIYPYVKSGVYFDNKQKNPMIISKRRFPYIYLTKDSGIELLGSQTLETEYSAAIPINEQRAADFDVGAMQFWMKFDKVEFPTTAFPVFEIQGSEKTIEFVIRTDASGKRGNLVARDKQSKFLENRIVFYQNGIRVKSPTVELDQWNAIGMSFDDPFVFDGIPGYITFFRGISFHNVTYFKSQGLGESVATLTRLWAKVFSDNDIDNLSWATWFVGEDVSVTQTRTNIAYNPSAEVDLKGWSPTGGGMSVSRITSDAKFGDASVQCVQSSSNNSGILFANLSGERISVDPNKEYTASAYVRIPTGSSDKTLRFRVRQYTDVTGGSILPIINGTQLFNFSSATGWIRVFFTFTTGASTGGIGLEISQQTGNIAGDTFYIDGLLLEESTGLVPKVNKYFDGSVAVGGLLAQSLAWNGTPHDSSSTSISFVPAEGQIRQWIDVYVFDQVLTYILNPQDIFKVYAGTNQEIIDSGQTLEFSADAVVSISDVKWNRISGEAL